MKLTAWGLDTHPDENWRLHAACRGHDPELWSLSTGRIGEQYRMAHAICDDCPVRRECGDFARNTGSWGMIFGGIDFHTPVRQPVIHDKICVGCRARFGTPDARQRYCTVKCRSKAHWARQAAARRAGAP